MKIITISTIRNEADIIETFVRYHLQIVDRMIVVTHRSVDDSERILSSLKSEGLPIDIHREDALELQQGSILTGRMKEALQQDDAAWFLPLDADEFVTASTGKNVRKILERFPTDRIIKIPWRTYVPLPSDDVQELNILKRICHRRAAEIPTYYKVLIPRKMAERKDALIAPGNHSLVKNARSRKKEMPSVITDELTLAHFPVRSADQVMTKAFVGWLACLAKPDREPTEAHHLKALYDRFKKRDAVMPDEVRDLALQYASNMTASEQKLMYEPVAPSAGHFELRYTTGYTCMPVTVLAEMAEEFAAELASLRRMTSTGNFSFGYRLRQWLPFVKLR